MIFIIAAVGRNREIGWNGTLPWHLPADLKHFRDVTSGKTIVMGRKTFESLPGLLPDRFHIVLTGNRHFSCEEKQVSVQHSVEPVLKLAKSTDLFVIGGARVFREFLPYTARIYLTVLDQNFKADVYFPEFDPCRWTKIQERQGTLDEKNRISHRFVTLLRNRDSSVSTGETDENKASQ